MKLDRENTNLRAMLSLKDCEIMSLMAAAAHWEAEKEKAYNKLIAVEEEVERLARKANAASAEIEKLKAELAAARAGTNAKELAETVDRLKAELAKANAIADKCFTEPNATDDHYRRLQAETYQRELRAVEERDAARAEVERLKSKLERERVRLAALPALLAISEAADVLLPMALASYRAAENEFGPYSDDSEERALRRLESALSLLHNRSDQRAVEETNHGK